MRLFKQEKINELFSERVLKGITDLKARDISIKNSNLINSNRALAKNVISQYYFTISQRSAQTINQTPLFHYGNQSQLHAKYFSQRILLPPSFSPYLKAGYNKSQLLPKNMPTTKDKPIQSKKQRQIRNFLNQQMQPQPLIRLRQLQKQQTTFQINKSSKTNKSAVRIIKMVDFDKIKMEQKQDHSKYVEHCVPQKFERSQYGEFVNQVNFVNDIIESRLEAVQIVFGQEESHKQKKLLEQRYIF